MSKLKAQKLTIRNLPGSEGRLTVGANTQVLLDGKPLRGLSRLNIEISARELSKVTLEMYVEVDAKVFTKLKKSKKTKTPFFNNSTGKHYARYELGAYAPKVIVTKK